MRERLGVLLVEEENGEIAVQLHSDPDRLAESFANLRGVALDPPRRATAIRLEYMDGKTEVRVKDLPLPEESRENAPDGYRLGEGPIYFDKEAKNEADSRVADQRRVGSEQDIRQG